MFKAHFPLKRGRLYPQRPGLSMSWPSCAAHVVCAAQPFQRLPVVTAQARNMPVQGALHTAAQNQAAPLSMRREGRYARFSRVGQKLYACVAE